MQNKIIGYVGSDSKDVPDFKLTELITDYGLQKTAIKAYEAFAEDSGIVPKFVLAVSVSKVLEPKVNFE